jgi:hypothetical protein
MPSCLLCGVLPGIALIHISDRDILAGGFLDIARKVCPLCPLLFVRRRDLQRQQVSEGTDGNRHFGAFAAFIPVAAGAGSALRSGLHRVRRTPKFGPGAKL